MRSYCLLSGDIEICSKCALSPFQSRKQVTGDYLHYIYSAMQQARNFMNSNPYLSRDLTAVFSYLIHSCKGDSAKFFLEVPKQKDKWQQTQAAEGKSSSQQERSNMGASCLERLWVLQPWGLSKLNWTRPWTEVGFTLSRQLDYRASRNPFRPNS